VQLCIFKARLTKIEKLKDIKHEYENSRKLARNSQKDNMLEKSVFKQTFTLFTILFISVKNA
jgi:hypothetical protein